MIYQLHSRMLLTLPISSKLEPRSLFTKFKVLTYKTFIPNPLWELTKIACSFTCVTIHPLYIYFPLECYFTRSLVIDWKVCYWPVIFDRREECRQVDLNNCPYPSPFPFTIIIPLSHVCRKIIPQREMRFCVQEQMPQFSSIHWSLHCLLPRGTLKELDFPHTPKCSIFSIVFGCSMFVTSYWSLY